jgi:hypothetical protein
MILIVMNQIVRHGEDTHVLQVKNERT